MIFWHRIKRNSTVLILSWYVIFCCIPNLVIGQPANPTIDNKDKLQLLVFSGSDWCIPCIKFERQVLQDSTFKDFAQQHLQIVIADFPQHSKLSPDKNVKNESLAKKYNPSGIFPYVLLLSAKGDRLTEIPTNHVTAEQVISRVRTYLPHTQLEEVSASLILMGSSFKITLVVDKSEGVGLLAESINEIQSIEGWLSSWKEGSITSQLNSAGTCEPILVPDDYYNLVKRCLAISALSQGAFDISFGGLGDLYKFDKQEHELPDQHKILAALAHVGYDKIHLTEDQHIYFTDSLLQIGFGAIGKGYAADRVKEMMIAKGVTGGVINASGDLTTWGLRANGENWKVGIPDPQDHDNILLWLPIKNKAIATSGDYEKYFLNKGVRYSHIINPQTGLPVIGASSVSVISNSAELSDALATAVSVLGAAVGIDLVNQIDGVECVFIDNNRNLHFSSGLQEYAY